MNTLLVLMLVSLLLPLGASFRSSGIWDRILCYTSLSTRTAVCLILISRFRHDPMIALVAVIVLSLGNSGLLLLANLIRGLEAECE
jgi:multicomponent Na+:H+ antiporter subunit F